MKHCQILNSYINLLHVWGNKIFMYKNKTLCFQNRFNKNLKHIKDIDIVDENGLKPLEFFSSTFVQKSNLFCKYNEKNISFIL